MAEQNQLSPELVVLSKKLNQAQADYDGLRSSMVQQVSQFRKLVKVVFDLDDGYFGGRFQSQEGVDAKSGQHDLAIALQVVEAVSEELQGASAFADSPLLRDQVANLVAAVEALRTVAIETDRAATQAVGFASSANQHVNFPARTFPDNNPLACLTEAVGFLRDLQGLVARLKDRVGALVMMAAEADEARNEAESATMKVVESRSSDSFANAISAELAARDAELAAFRAQALKEQDAHAEDARRMRGEIRERVTAATDALAHESELRRSDLAEARSLAAEIERLASADPEAAKNDDLDITLGVLRESLDGENQELSGITAAAEQVLVQWTRIIGERAASAAKEVSTVRWQLGEANAKVAPLQAEITRLTAEIKRLTDSEKGLINAREAVSKELSTLRTQVAEQSRDLQTRDLAFQGRDEAAARSQEQAQRAAEELARERASRKEDQSRHREALTQAEEASKQTSTTFETVITRARDAAETAERQLAEVRLQVGGVRTEAEQAKTEAARIQAELARVTETLRNAQQREAQAAEARVRSERQAQEARAKSDAGITESSHLRGEVERLHAELTKAAEARDAALARDQSASAARIDAERAHQQLTNELHEALQARKQADTHVSGLTARIHDLERDVAALTAVRDRLSQTEAAALDTGAKLAQAEQTVLSLKTERDRLAADVQAVRAEALARERRGTESEQDRSRTQGLLSERERRIAEMGSESERLRESLADITAKATSATAELARLKTLHEGAVQARDQATAELAIRLKSEAAATAERDTVKAALTSAYGERDRLQAQAERQRVDLEQQHKKLQQREDEFSARLAEGARQVGESRQIADTVSAENERLRKEIERTSEQADRAEKRSASNTTTERKLTETSKLMEEAQATVERLEGKLAVSETRLAELAGEISKSQEAVRQQADYIETESSIAQAYAQRCTLDRNELMGLVKDSRIAVQNAKIARESDLQRIAELEGELTILKSLRPT